MRSLLLFLLLLPAAFACAQDAKPVKNSGNPLFPGWYADPEATIYDHTYWIFPTWSDGEPADDPQLKLSDFQSNIRKNTINPQYLRQTFFDAFSSTDLVNWQKHPRVLDVEQISWAGYALWAPSVIRKGKEYFLFFGANDIQNDNQPGGIGVAVSDKPEGPYHDYLGKPLVNKFYNGAQPIDQFVFHDTDGKYYLIYGGWRHCNIGQLKGDFTGFVDFPDGNTFHSITPDQYVEGPFMFVRKNKYYLMWSEGGWTGPAYSVAYAMADSPLGPFRRIGKILQQDPEIATGAGHHSVINLPGTDEWYIVYHRRPLTTRNGHHRQTCLDKMLFDDKGLILPVKITKEGVAERPL
ncbi:MAG: glycoside hydrolase family 43 protein [Marinilabiliales bacterium]|nr:glycoside hydrolase family 43 protein [Marinilabiliales bacterium]